MFRFSCGILLLLQICVSCTEFDSYILLVELWNFPYTVGIREDLILSIFFLWLDFDDYML